MITINLFNKIIGILGEQAKSDLQDCELLGPPKTPETFADELIYIICNAGMKNTAGRNIRKKCMAELREGRSAASVFSHPTKGPAIDRVWSDRKRLHANYLSAKTDFDKLEFLATLPWIGPATKYHAGKSFGLQIAKPDRHLERLATLEGTTSQLLCERLAKETGRSVPQVDTILWRACSLGILDSNTGKLTGRGLPTGYEVHKPNRS